MKLEDIHDWRPAASNSEHIPEIMPYPDLTERERRLIIYYYSNYRARYLADLRLIGRLGHFNDRLLEMIDGILE